MSAPIGIGPTHRKKRDAKFYRDLAEDARMLAARLQDEKAQFIILEVAAAFARIAARLHTEEL